MAKEFHVGETAQVKVVKLVDAHGNETDTWDKISGIQYTADHPESVTVDDEDAEPRDAVVSFIGLTPAGEDSFVRATLDGDPGDGVTEINLVTEAFQVVAGPAVAGMLTLDIMPEE
jgi:hypothetical protein